MDMFVEKKPVAIISRDKIRGMTMSNAIHQRSKYHVREFSKMEDMPTQLASKVSLIILLIDEHADLLLALHVYKSKGFVDIPMIAVADVNRLSKAQALILSYTKEFWRFIGTEDDIVDVLESIIGPFPKPKKTFMGKIEMVLRMIFGWLL